MKGLIFLLLVPLLSRAGPPKRVVYRLDVQYKGKGHRALAVNGTIPGPTLYFTEGDTAVIYVHNSTNRPTVIHWHGILLPNQYDGVAYLTTMPVGPGETHLFTFPVRQSGTYWYHSHYEWQEQEGLYGAIVILKRDELPGPEYTLLLSDWTHESPYEVDRSLHAGTDWYGIRKGSAQSYGEAIRAGYLRTKLGQEWRRMFPMDVSDVAYDRVLANGKITDTVDVTAGRRIHLHLINGSSSTYFWVQFAGGQMTVTANDGADVTPVTVDRLIIAVAETYDVTVTLPDTGAYELRATSEDRSLATSLWLGKGTPHRAPVLPRLSYFKGMQMMIRMEDNRGMQMSNQVMDMNRVMYPESAGVTLNYGMLRSPVLTTLPDGPFLELHFNLTGNMNRYVWSINNKTVSEADKIYIRRGENVRIILYNGTMMRHPMHLHGHFFRVLNGQGAYAPLKNTLDILPMETDTLEFRGSATGDWFFHCHILYHMMSGMGRIFEYEDNPSNPEVPDTAMAMKMVAMDDRMAHPSGFASLESNGSIGAFTVSGTRLAARTEWKIGLGPQAGYESEGMVGRYLGQSQWWFPFLGWDLAYRNPKVPRKNLFGQVNTVDNRKVATAGIQYLLPMLVLAEARVDMNGRVRVQLSREDLPLTARLRLDAMGNTDGEYLVGLRYVLTKYLAVSTHYDSDLKFGVGLTIRY